MSKKAKYMVCVIDHNSYVADQDGNFVDCVCVRDCGHEHRTLTGAYRCLNKLNYRNSDGTRSANWFNAEIRHTDKSQLTGLEAETLSEIEFEMMA